MSLLCPILKSMGIISVVFTINFTLEMLGLSPQVLSTVWGVLCFIVFVDSTVLQADHKHLHQRFDDMVKHYTFLQDLYKTSISTIQEYKSDITSLSPSSLKSQYTYYSKSSRDNSPNTRDKMQIQEMTKHETNTNKISEAEAEMNSFVKQRKSYSFHLDSARLRLNRKHNATKDDLALCLKYFT